MRMAINWDAPIEIRDARNGEWYWVQKEILSCKEINSSDKLVYSALAYYANGKTQIAYPSYKTIANLVNLSRNTVIKAIRNLITNNFISKKQKERNVNYYSLLKITSANFALVQNNVGGSAKEILPLVQNRATNNNNITRIINKRYATPTSLEESDYQDIATKYEVPIAFVRSKHDDLINYCGAKGKGYKNYRLALMDWVKRDSFKLRKEANEHVSKRGIDARGIK